MAKKGKDQQKQVASKHVTTRRLARWEREKRQQRITFLSGIVIVIIVLGIIIGGVISTRSSDWLSKVETGSGTITIGKADYADEMDLFRVGVYNSSAMTNESPLIFIEKEYLYSDKAEEAGLDVSEAEINDLILSFLGMPNTSISDTAFQQKYNGILSNYSISDDKFRDGIETLLIEEKIFEYYVNQTPASGMQAALQTIIVTNESDANAAAQLWRNGNDFEAISAIYGGYNQSGWVAIDALDDSLRDVVSTIEIGNVSDPVNIFDTGDSTSSSTEYYYVLKVLERKDDILPDSLRQQWGYKEFETWFEQAYVTKVERNPDIDLSEIYAWAIEQLS